MSERVHITIIGAGVVGCAIAYQLSKIYNDVIVVEKNPKVTAENQSSRNSGVVHAGVYYPRDLGRLKGELCVKGNGMLYDFCREFDVPIHQTGKLIVATKEQEIDFLEDTLRIARENMVPGARRISADEAKKMEPNIRCLSAAFFPTSGIVEVTQLVYRLFTLATNQEAFFLTNTRVVAIKPRDSYFEIQTEAGQATEIFETDILINSAGLYSDEIAKKVNPDCRFEINPIRGEAVKFLKTRRADIFHHGLNIYPVPHPIYPDGTKAEVSFQEFQRLFHSKQVLKTVGVHVTPTFDISDGRYEIGNTVTIGPATKGVLDREDNASDLLPPELYLNRVQSFFPNLRLDDISLHQAGVQAKLKNYFDWVIEPDEKHPRCIQLIGIDSPGLTSCLAIANYVADLVAAM
ncbi:MAG: NAD(P)/FAD-dependent oxidoreductase [Candidatus Zhuqueibacterota bacterium]